MLQPALRPLMAPDNPTVGELLDHMEELGVTENPIKLANALHYCLACLVEVLQGGVIDGGRIDEAVADLCVIAWRLQIQRSGQLREADEQRKQALAARAARLAEQHQQSLPG